MHVFWKGVVNVGKYTAEDIMRMVEDENIRFIRLQFTDIFGSFKNIAITASQLEKALQNKCMFDGSSIEGFVRIEESDMYLYPDLDSFVIFPWYGEGERAARLICDVYKPDGTPFEGDPRGLLKKVLRQAEEMGKLLAGITFDAVYSSPLGRAVDTVRIAFQGNVQPIQDERLLQYITTGSRPAPRFYDALDGSVGLLKLIPGTRRELLAFMADHYDGLVIEGFGVGGLPEYDGFYDVVRQAAEAGKLIVMTTQVPNEGSDLTVYHVGGHLKHTLQVLEAYDMTTESAVCKLMWILGQTRDFAQAEKLFYTPVSRDILRFSGE